MPATAAPRAVINLLYSIYQWLPPGLIPGLISAYLFAQLLAFIRPQATALLGMYFPPLCSHLLLGTTSTYPFTAVLGLLMIYAVHYLTTLVSIHIAKGWQKVVTWNRQAKDTWKSYKYPILAVVCIFLIILFSVYVAPAITNFLKTACTFAKTCSDWIYYYIVAGTILRKRSTKFMALEQGLWDAPKAISSYVVSFPTMACEKLISVPRWMWDPIYSVGESVKETIAATLRSIPLVRYFLTKQA
ncbi:MAG: hypothetical protein Q9170_001616 [Blastenia crenularia]